MASRSEAAANAAADATTALLDGGYLRLLDARRRVLAELRFGIPAFRTAEHGIAFGNVNPTYRATATGYPTTFEARTFGEDLVFEGVVGLDLILDRDHIEAGATVTIGQLTYAERTT